jgi:hypothetical protein
MDLREIVEVTSPSVASLLLLLITHGGFVVILNDELGIVPSLVNYAPRITSIAYISPSFSLARFVARPMVMVRRLGVGDRYERALDLLESVKYALNFAPDVVGFDLTMIDEVDHDVELKVITSASPSHLGRVLVFTGNGIPWLRDVLHSEYLGEVDTSILRYAVYFQGGGVDFFHVSNGDLVRAQVDDSPFGSMELDDVYRRIRDLLARDPGDPGIVGAIGDIIFP